MEYELAAERQDAKGPDLDPRLLCREALVLLSGLLSRGATTAQKLDDRFEIREPRTGLFYAGVKFLAVDLSMSLSDFSAKYIHTAMLALAGKTRGVDFGDALQELPKGVLAAAENYHGIAMRCIIDPGQVFIGPRLIFSVYKKGADINLARPIPETSADAVSDRPAFEVRTADHTYRIWANGKTEGFDSSAVPFVIINRIPILLAQAHDYARGQ